MGIIRNIPVLFGVPSEEVRNLPLRGIPEGTKRHRIRWRNQQIATVVTKGEYGTRAFWLLRHEDHLLIDPEFEQGHNQDQPTQ